MKPLRFLVADDHELVRKGVCAMLLTRPGWVVAGEARDGREAVDKAKKLGPDVIIMDISMPRLNGLEATRQITQNNSGAKVLVLTVHESETVVREAMNAGACGYVLKTDPGSYLIKGVDALRRDQIFFTPSLAAIAPAVRLKKSAAPAKPAEPNSLTPRQREILQLLAEGKTSKQIGVALDLSIKTVETHRTHIMNRLNCHSISALVRYAIRNHVIEA